jgi:hypothetical protein
MKRTLLTGALLAVAGALAVYVGAWLNLGLRSSLYGAALGAVLGLVTDRSVLGRLGAFLGGVVIAWIGYAVRAQFLPDSNSGQVIAVLVVVALITGMVLLSFGRLPMWAGLLGAAALIGAYEELYSAAPYNFISESVVAVSGLLVPVGFGFLVGVVSSALGGEEDEFEPSPAPLATPSPGLAIMNKQGEAAS